MYHSVALCSDECPHAGTPTTICTAVGPRALAGLLAPEVPEPPNASVFSSIKRGPPRLQHDRKRHQQELSPAAVKTASPDHMGGGSLPAG